MPRVRLFLALLSLVLLTTACKNRYATPPVYPPRSELETCREGECVEADFGFRHWAHAEYFRGKIIYHCDPGSELDGPADPTITRMIVVIHGVIGPSKERFAKLSRPPGLTQLRHVQNALRKATEADPSLDPEAVAIIAPSFQRTTAWQPYTDEDKRYWTWSGASYKVGADSEENQGFAGAIRADSVSAFDLLDEFLRAGLIKFPNLEQIVVVGHSAGGQTVHRYAMFGVGVHEHVEHEGVGIRYLPADQAYYTFLDVNRKLEPGKTSVRPGRGVGDTQSWHWAVPRGCDGYDDYAYGVGKLAKNDRARRAADYAIDHYLRTADRRLARKALADDYGKTWTKAARLALQMQYAHREVWHIQANTDVEVTFPGNCKTQVQGRSRLERFLHFEEMWSRIHMSTPGLHWVLLENPRHHHSSKVVYASDAGRHVLFY